MLSVFVELQVTMIYSSYAKQYFFYDKSTTTSTITLEQRINRVRIIVFKKDDEISNESQFIVRVNRDKNDRKLDKVSV